MKKYILLAFLIIPFLGFAQKGKDKNKDSEELIQQLYNDSSIKLANGDLGGALKDLNKLDALNAPLILFRYNLAHVLYETGDLKGAEQQYVLFLQEEPNHLEALFNLSNIKTTLNDDSGALNIIDISLKINNKDPNLYFNKGLLLFKMGKVKEANQNWKLASNLGSVEADKLLKQFGN
jgi:tetratricopeptide (TPR) repeat protein